MMLSQPLRKLTGHVLDLFYPWHCVVCDRLGTMLCSVCEPLLQKVSGDLCVTCGGVLESSQYSEFRNDSPVQNHFSGDLSFASNEKRNQTCGACRVNLSHCDSHRSLYVFGGEIRNLIHRLKYDSEFWVRRFFEREMMHFSSEFQDCDAVVPVPLHPKRLRERGFNQSLLIAMVWARLLQKPLLPQALIRERETAPQTGQSGTERRRNLRGAFLAIRPEIVVGKKILLIDDVRTTGATLDECARALKKAGVTSVIAGTLAMTTSIPVLEPSRGEC